MKKIELVVLVNRKGRKTGLAEKLEAHEKGLLHRAFSVFLFNDKNEMLLQQRAATKYHFAGLWSNACCSHPRVSEKILSAAKRRLKEELNLRASIKLKSTITYKFFDTESGLTEHEFDYIFIGKYDGKIDFNNDEVAAVKWISISQLKKEIKLNPEIFTPWFKEIFMKVNSFQ
ncbi:MAG: isopentenyl-diphosphate Delta-isomerase [Chitinophagales bacterium]|nr:isopentenyl-diphosphate Delta-isomerase [Chitinophagales bacterium]